MPILDNAATLIFLAIVLCTAAVAVALTTRLLRRRDAKAFATGHGGLSTGLFHTYKFREGYLLSDISPDDPFLDADADRSNTFRQLLSMLTPLNPEMTDRIKALQERGEPFLLDARMGSDLVSIGGREESGELVLTVGPGGETAGRQVVETATLETLQSELADLRATLDSNSALIWREDERRRVIWGNAAYVTMVERMRDGETPGWPLPQLFADQLEPAPSDGTLRRCQLNLPDREDPAWFEVSREALSGGTALFTAQRIDRLIAAETSLRTFLQTSTKTFAALPIGLAVFDRRRELVTFNPALLNLSEIPFDFLSTRPDLSSFLDALRERQRIPEPRDYKAWRNEITRLEEGAENGTYQELWELPDGKSFRVLGRPHPDGAIAFMFEDISAEVSLTRQFRADLAMFQAVLDTLPVGLAVFKADGSMLSCNSGYARLWGQDPTALDHMPSLGECTALWAANCEPSGVWADIRSFVAHEVERGPWLDEVCSRAGVRLSVRMVPAKGRATVVQFVPMDESLSDPLAELAENEPTPLLDAARAVSEGSDAAKTA
ncbi:PAS-domain containing protein [Gymnodinialimonas hymeniacidonis]|uniref:PAS-domain containing protein n=1 Tax=Gymnodinialimonas hymeniacidonis TaxID=3126508 RepID=UPI0034C5EAAE